MFNDNKQINTLKKRRDELVTTYERLWQMVLELQQEEKELHEQITSAIDHEKMKKVLNKIKSL